MIENVVYGPTELYVGGNEIDELYKEGEIFKEGITKKYAPNHYLVLRSLSDPKQTAVGRVTSNNSIKNIVFQKNLSICGLTPKDVGQFAFANSLIDEKILLSTALGAAGTGKTSVALAYALEMHFTQNKKIYLTKPTALVSNNNNAFGPIPGDVQDKYSPFIASYQIVLQNLLGEKSKPYVQALFHNKDIEYIPIEYSRGCTYQDCTFIVDEVQNLSWHELKTIVSRMGQNTKLILIGDPYQLDTVSNLDESGLHVMLNSKSYNTSKITSTVYLKGQYRGPMATLVTDIDTERGVFHGPKPDQEEKFCKDNLEQLG